jgi:glyoxylate reductase
MTSVYVSRPLPEPGVSLLRAAGFDVEEHEVDAPPARAALLSRVADKAAILSMLTERIDAKLMDAAPGLRVVANLAVGYDNIDVPAATERGIVVTNTPDVLTEATADLAWTLLMAAARRLGEGDRLVRAGEWKGWSPTQLLGQAVWGQTIGIVGMGKIGTAVARRARGFGMSVIYRNRSPRPQAEAELDARPVDLPTLWREADFVSLHAPLTEQTRHIVDADALSRMRDTAVLVNTARGPLVDEAALVDALRGGAIAAAGLDVFESEPSIDAGLAPLENVVLAPHIGSATIDARSAMVRCCSDNIVAVLKGDPPLTPLNPEVLGS